MTAFRHTRILVALAGLSLLLGAAAFAQGPDEADVALSAITPPGPADPITEGGGAIEGLLFMGTSQNSNVPTDTLNDIYTVDPNTDVSASILSNTQVWGATADPAGQRVLFTRASGLTPPPGQIGGGDELMEVPYGGGPPTALGRITLAGEGLRIDGLALSGGVLYGANAGAGADNGLYTIDLNTLVATLAGAYGDSISGIDADPDTGTIYGVNDSTGQLVELSTTGTITNVAAYPVGFSDIDGIAVGGGFAYLVTDEAQAISVYDLINDVFVTPLTSPFASADVFSGAAYAVPSGGGGGGASLIDVPVLTPAGLALLTLLLVGGAIVVLRRGL